MPRFQAATDGRLPWSDDGAKSGEVLDVGDRWVGVTAQGNFQHGYATLVPRDAAAQARLDLEIALKRRRAPMPPKPSDFDPDWVETEPMYFVNENVDIEGVGYVAGEAIDLVKWPTHPLRRFLTPANTAARETLAWLDGGFAQHDVVGSVPFANGRMLLVGHPVIDGRAPF